MVRIGDLIKLRGYKGKSIVRRFLGVRNETVLICSDGEFQAACREKRKPIAVGFRLHDVIGARAQKSIGQHVGGLAENTSSTPKAHAPSQPRRRLSHSDRTSDR